jgi:hypothetical protein
LYGTHPCEYWRRVLDFIRATYVVPDARVVSSELSKLRIRSSKARTFPLLGGSLSTTWSGDDRGTGIIRMLNRQTALNSYSRAMHNLTIAAVPDKRCWTMTTHVGTRGSIIADSLLLVERLTGLSSTGARRVACPNFERPELLSGCSPAPAPRSPWLNGLSLVTKPRV